MPDPRSSVGHVVRGMFMGSADVIPGVSGGTVALIFGIYERLVRSISEAASAGFRLVRGDIPAFRERLGRVEWAFIIPLGIGIVLALGVGSRIIPGLIDAYPSQVSAVFFGLILGSLAIPFRRIGSVGATEVALIIAFAVGAFVLVGLPPRELADPPLYVVFLSAAIAICAMILPGISGAFLLYVIGIYRPTLEAVASFDIPYVLTFVAGAAIGLALFSQLLEWLLEHRHAATMAALTGLMAGSLRALWPWLDEDRAMLAPPDPQALAVVLVLGSIAFTFVTFIAWFAGRQERDRAVASS